MDNLKKNDMPTYLIVLSLIFIFPLGIYFIVLKTENYLDNIKRNACFLKMCGYIGFVFVVVYFFINYNVYLSLIDSHMSLDMYSFNFIYIYFYVLMVTLSTLIGGALLDKKCEKLVIYTEFINIRHIKDINLISEETLESIDEVKETIVKLIDKGYLINVRLEDEHIVSTKTVDKNLSKRLVRCKSCGNIKELEKDKVRCDFCLRKLNKKDLL